jgi:hypothetical protein
MKQLFVFFTFCLCFFIANAQYYQLPVWVEDLPYSFNKDVIYAIGISDPRMTDTLLAEKTAIHRAITMTVLFNSAKIYYASDYFETKSEEYRWFVIKEDIEELGKVEAQAYVENNSYEILQKQINKNGETLVLIRYISDSSKDANFFVKGEYYRQDFELSNTRAHESIRSIKIETKWKQNDRQDTLKSSFHMSNYNGDISCWISYDNKKITPPGFFYHYEPSIPDRFNIVNYNTSVSLLKGLWIAYLDSYMQSILKISKNYSSKMETVYNGYKVNRNDGITETSQESLARSVCRNTLSFEFGGIGINKNSLYPRFYLYGERYPYTTYVQIEQKKADSIVRSQEVNKKCWFIRLFSK